MPPSNKPRDIQQPTNASRPLMPSLASSRNVKSPITPRLAGQYLAATTPSTTKTARSNTPTTIRSNATTQDMPGSVKALISPNITPRSALRRSRNEASPNASPSGTPDAARPSSAAEGGVGVGGRRGPGIGALGISSNGSAKSRPMSMMPGLYSATTPPSTGSNGLGSMFFHAGEIPMPQEPQRELKKSPVFFYANGQHDDGPGRALNNPSPPLSNLSTSRPQKNQFFRADGKDEDIPPVPSLPSPSIHSPALVPHLQAAPTLRAPSPTKDGFNPHLSYRKGASQIIRPNERPKAVSIFTPSGPSHRQKAISGAGSHRPRHGRTSSLSSIEPALPNRRHDLATLNTFGLSPLQSPSSLANVTSSPMQFASSPPSAQVPSPVPKMVDDLPQRPARSRQTSASSPLAISFPQSPTKQTWAPQNLPEFVMNARVERKIQDLEISNSSLLAINRSLEKEVRRQKKEIRHFRRLSRAGRLSGIGVQLHEQAAKSETSHLPHLSERDEPEDEAENEASSGEEDDTEGNEDDDDVSTDSSSGAESDGKMLAKDSKRLQIDLSRHRDILVDSQKMNQSLKRCMTWTEDLIAEGKRALEYKVNVSDVQLGGRVLEPVHAEEEDHYEADHSLLSSWSATPTPILEHHTGILDGGRESWQSEEADSGIEIDSSRGSQLPEEGLDGLHDLVSDLDVAGTKDGSQA